MKMILMALLTLSAVNSFAQTESSYLGVQGLHDVVAPVVFGDPATGDKIQGMIYYDSNTGAFKGIGNSGNVVVMGTTSGNPVVSGGSSERVERLNFSGSTTPNTSNCTGNPCQIETNGQSGTWVTSVTRSGAGSYTVNFVGGTFSSAPSCTCSARVIGADTRGACSTSSMTASSITVTTWGYGSTSQGDSAVSVICMGPR